MTALEFMRENKHHANYFTNQIFMPVCRPKLHEISKHHLVRMPIFAIPYRIMAMIKAWVIPDAISGLIRNIWQELPLYNKQQTNKKKKKLSHVGILMEDSSRLPTSAMILPQLKQTKTKRATL